MTQPAVCVYCRRHPVEEQWRPFCSERCKQRDLAAWADGTYRIPAADHVRTATDSDEALPEDGEA